ncbi:MAG: cysteine hydrolase [Candidatus Thermoplasmatota archaeon]|nr:cysteine hydrolase [Candidatus Thermoplasmatota archaeon]
MYIPDVIPLEDRENLLGKYRSPNGSAEPDLGKNPALLIVDMTNGFVMDRFRTGFSKTGIPCSANIKKMLDLFRRKKLPVIYTRDMTSDQDVYRIHRGTWNNKSEPVPADQRTDYNTIYSEIAPLKGEPVIEKSKPSAFFGTPLISMLNYLHVTGIVLTGMVTSGCVRATALDAFSYNYTVAIPQECVADRSKISHEVTLFDLDLKYAYVLSSSEIAGILNRSNH